VPNDGNARVGSYTKGKGIYLFCIARPPLRSLMGFGLDEQCLMSQQTFKDVTAVFCKVPLDDLCGPSAEARLQDLAWIGPRACRHEEVVEHVMRHSPVLPARFGTIFLSLESLEKFLQKCHGTISGFLDQVSDKEEWAVKGFLDTEKARQALFSTVLAREGERFASLSPGMRYFQEKRSMADLEKGLSHWLKDVCNGICTDLNIYFSEFRERKVLSLDAGGTNRNMVLNWAFLVIKSSVEGFRARVRAANEEHEGQGLTFELSGPWPPYSFCPSLDME
jgi:hypothetical protein